MLCLFDTPKAIELDVETEPYRRKVSIQLSTSVVLTIAVALLIFGVIPAMIRVCRPSVAATQLDPVVHSVQEVKMSQAPHSPQNPAATQDPAPAQNSASVQSVREGSPMASGQTTAPATAAGAPASTDEQPPLRIYWGRVVIFTLGVLAILALPVGIGTALAGGSGWILPISIVVAVASFVTLRVLAVRDERKRMQAFYEQQMIFAARRQQSGASVAPQSMTAENAGSQQSGATSSKSAATTGQAQKTQANSGQKAATGQDTPFDVQEGKASEPQQQRFTPEELREMARAYAEGLGQKTKNNWKPVGTPKPLYVDAAKAERPAPQSLVLPKEPKPQGEVKIKPGQAKAPEPAAEDAKPTVDEADTAEETKSDKITESKTENTPQSALDDVLKRRRA